MKKQLALILALVMCLCLSACGDKDMDDDDQITGDDWRTTGVVRANGVITRSGEDTDVLVCVDRDNATFYYDDIEQTLFDYVTYPMQIVSDDDDPWEAFQSIDFADRDGDGNSDVAMIFTVDGDTALLVWFWDADRELFVFQSEESETGNDSDVDLSDFEGTWLGTESGQPDYIEISDGSWAAYLNGEMTDGGDFRYEPELGAVYAYGSDRSGSYAELHDNGETLYISSLGSFSRG